MVCNEKPVPRQISFGFYLWKTRDIKSKYTVKPVHNGHPWTLKNWPFDRGALIKVRFILAIAELYRPLLTGGRCSEVVVKAGFTVHSNNG